MLKQAKFQIVSKTKPADCVTVCHNLPYRVPAYRRTTLTKTETPTVAHHTGNGWPQCLDNEKGELRCIQTAVAGADRKRAVCRHQSA